MCKYVSTCFDGLPLYKTNGVNALSCGNFLSADFISAYPFALLKLWRHVVLDGLFFPGGDFSFVPDKKCCVPPG